MYANHTIANARHPARSERKTDRAEASTRILIVGCGSIGRRHARVLQALGVSAVALCDPADVVRTAAATELGIPETYGTLDEALEQRFDAVFICSPPEHHVPQSTLAIQSGCDVFTEKPLSDRMQGVDELIALAEREGRVLMVGLCMRFHPGLLRVRELVADGAIGRLVSVRASVGVYLPGLRPGVDYRQVYIARPGGGVTLDYLHEIDFVQWIAGAKATEVFAFTGKLRDVEMQADDTAEILLRLDSGAVASIHLDVFQRAKRRQTEFMGTEGTIIIDLADWSRCTIQTYRASRCAWQADQVPMERDDIYRDEDCEFLRCVEGRNSPSLGGAVGKTSLQVALAAIESSRRGELIRLDGNGYVQTSG